MKTGFQPSVNASDMHTVLKLCSPVAVLKLLFVQVDNSN